MPNLLPDWHFFRPAGRLIWFSVILIIMMIPVIVALRRPKSDKPTTWAQAMAGAVYVFALFLLAYAIIPHEFITFCRQVPAVGQGQVRHQVDDRDPVSSRASTGR